ncbi:hypothetical protein ACWF99_12135 [Nocardia sp. NPDC055002]
MTASEGKALNSVYDRRELDIANQVMEAELPTSHLLVPWGGAKGLDYTYCAMPLAETNLKDYLQSTQIDLTEIREILQEVATGLVQLAALGILHQDMPRTLSASVLTAPGRNR